jgi:hypothetical protein
VSFFLPGTKPAILGLSSMFKFFDLAMVLVAIASFQCVSAKAQQNQEVVVIAAQAQAAETFVAKPARQFVTIQNNGDKDLILEHVHSTSRLVDLYLADHLPIRIPAHSGKEVAIEFVSRLLLGVRGVPFDADFVSDAGEHLSARGTLRIFVENALDAEDLELNLGVVSNHMPVTKSLSINSRETSDISLSKVLEAPKFLAVNIEDHGRSISIATGKDVPWGISDGYVGLKTTSNLQPEVWVHYHLDMHGDVIPSQNPVNFAPENVGAEQEETVRLESVNGKPIHIRSISSQGAELNTRVDDCAPPQAECKLLRLVLAADAPSGQIAGVVTISFEGLSKSLPIQIGGFRLAKGQKLKSLTENTVEQTSVAMTKANAVDIGKAVDLARKVGTVLTPPAGDGPLLKWTVAHEQTIYGYVVYRGVTETGPFQRLTKDIIPSLKEDENGASYQWRDTSAEPGKTYWYYVAALQNDGHKRKLSDPQKVVAK